MFVWAWIACALLIISHPAFSLAQVAPATMPTAPGFPALSDAVANSGLNSAPPLPENSILGAERQLPDFSKRETFSSAMQIIILLTVLSLAPAILLMMTSFTRIIIVLSLLRQALGTQQLPPNQIMIG